MGCYYSRTYSGNNRSCTGLKECGDVWTGVPGFDFSLKRQYGPNLRKYENMNRRLK